jgi:Holliday junction resolvase
MPNSNYARGVRLERLWMAQMRAKGYVAMRSAGSHGLIDCIAWNREEVIMAQVKNGNAAYSDKDIGELLEMKRPIGVSVFLVVRDGGKQEWEWIRC